MFLFEVLNVLQKWLSDIGGACLAVIVVRMLFAPVYNSDKTSALWWWRFYRYLRQTDDGGETRNKKKKTFQTWGALYRGRRRRESMHDEVSHSKFWIKYYVTLFRIIIDFIDNLQTRLYTCQCTVQYLQSNK